MRHLSNTGDDQGRLVLRPSMVYAQEIDPVPCESHAHGKTMTLADAVAKSGNDVRAKLNDPAATGEPEDQLRGPLENLIADANVPNHKAFDIGRTALVRRFVQH